MQIAMEPSTASQIELELARLFILFPHGKASAQETAARIDMYVEGLEDIPFDILQPAFRQVAKTCTFFPAIAEIREAARPALGERSYKIIQLQNLVMKHKREYREETPENELADPADVAKLLKGISFSIDEGE